MGESIIIDDFKDFFSYLDESLPDSANYMNLSNLCLALFFTVDFLPVEFKLLELNKETLSIVFSKICKKRNIATYPYEAYLYGASFHNSHDKGHWLEILASTLKLNTKPNIEEAKSLLTRE
ncbi:hypothetical protein [Tenacibaculum sp. 190524A02b]|uniref:hypothetical protein n=1 Tax=Tenacibaculum vairaonense TaxID=3137860 RepID=UPI0031FB0C9B